MPDSCLITAESVVPATPAELGFNPTKFPAWRNEQLDSIENNLNCPTRTAVHDMPVGTGKSLAALATAEIMGQPSVVLTATNPLLDQYIADFPACALIKGRANYACSMGWRSCDEGAAGGCTLRGTTECNYRRAYTDAKEARVVVTNYAYWLSISRGEGLGERRLLILDEAHNCPNIICDSVAVTITSKEIRLARIPLPELARRQSATVWATWGRQQMPTLKGVIAEYEAQAGRDTVAGDLILLKRLQNALTTLIEGIDLGESWAVDQVGGWKDREHAQFSYVITPVIAGRYTEQRLLRGVPQALLYSATINKQTLLELGMSPVDYTFYEYDSPFPLDRMPIYYWPVATVSATRRDFQTELAKAYAAADRIIDDRLDRKGIIHAGSYERMEQIVRTSRHRRHMISHTSRDTALYIEQFKKSDAPAILVSPTVTTGYDFAGQYAEYQIVVKLPFIDTRSSLMRARTGKDFPANSAERILGNGYGNSICATTLAQIAGRPMRSATDRCETFLLDANYGWFIGGNRRHFPRTFLRAVKNWSGKLATPPEPYRPSLYAEYAEAKRAGLLRRVRD